MVDEAPHVIRLSPIQRILVELLLTREMVTREAAYQAMYGHRPDADQPQWEHIVDEHITHLRRRLPADIPIEREWAVGWYLTQASRAKLQALMDRRP